MHCCMGILLLWMCINTWLVWEMFPMVRRKLVFACFSTDLHWNFKTDYFRYLLKMGIAVLYKRTNQISGKSMFHILCSTFIRHGQDLIDLLWKCLCAYSINNNLRVDVQLIILQNLCSVLGVNGTDSLHLSSCILMCQKFNGLMRVSEDSSHFPSMKLWVGLHLLHHISTIGIRHLISNM